MKLRASGSIKYNMAGTLKELYHRRVFIKVCLQIDPEFYEWGLSARSVHLTEIHIGK